DQFGRSVALDQSRVVAGAPNESSSSYGLNGEQENNNAPRSGAVYVFELSSTTQWSQTMYIKASNTGAGDLFGDALALDDRVMVVGAEEESSTSMGLDGDQNNDDALESGAVYVRLLNAEP
ncbi:MAG: integrin, partial [Myxococcota bacterium]